MDEESFLQSIWANPADDTKRLVYADWLEERGDPRCEYIRPRLELRKGLAPANSHERLNALVPTIEDEWRRRVFCVPKLSIKQFRRVNKPITDLISKWGGQPVWVDRPMWPVAVTGEVMQFQCQIKVPDFFGAPLAGKMVYVFQVGPEWKDWREFAEEAHIEVLDPECGENAVIIQPDGDPPTPIWVDEFEPDGQRRRGAPLQIEERNSGPGLYDSEGNPGEWVCEFEEGTDPDYTPNSSDFWDQDAWNAYWEQVYGRKIGGTPLWGNGRESDIDSLANDPDWRVLLQFQGLVPHLNIWEAFGWWVWVSRDAKRGILMGDR